ncbi:MAG: tRNA (N6-isopentenyl adenosine(37)-C2)-methylthiotransferase MiaB [Spirochaetaceae bacterium]|jgi:tRNA-2-methylthio-N6-dimethylallyladenosine synthase|nr:tRNA (N6-isopentenyl adenosine(37)-C2)-methylthiotransferase MiaB [Spirochaetaceae bacterium]
MTYFFETYGCQMNMAESAAAALILTERGWTAASAPEYADLIIINTCSVRITAETRVHGRLGLLYALKKKQPFTLILMGCMAERAGTELKKRFPYIDHIVGTFEKHRIGDIAAGLEAIQASLENPELLSSSPSDDAYQVAASKYHFAHLSWERGSPQAFVPIMHGCNNFCSYCIVPYVRGREISRSPDEILKELEFLAANGVREVTLLGQNVNSYRWQEDSGEVIDFPGLLERAAQRLAKIEHNSIGWIRFVSSHPKDLSTELLKVMARERIFCRHIHLPVQSGSNAVLKAMNRKYTREDYLALVARIREILPDVSLTTDILTGFPGETEENAEDTVKLLQEVRFDSAFMYYYNPREGTAACSLPNPISKEVKKERLARIIEVQHGITREILESRVGTRVRVLAESVSRNNPGELLARTERDERVVFPGNEELIGSFVELELTGLNGNTFMGKEE